jgi:hypothetical protein
MTSQLITYMSDGGKHSQNVDPVRSDRLELVC